MLTQEQQIFEQIKKAQNILITFSKTWNGDTIASALAFYLFLKKLDKSVNIVAEKFEQGDAYNFLPAFHELNHSLDNLRKFIISLDISNTKVDKIKYKVKENTLNFIISPKDGFFTNEDISSRASGFKYDLIITLDTPDLESLGAIYDNDTEFFYQVPIINIDHNPDNEEYGQINYVNLTSIATSEILFNLFINYSRDVVDEDIATCILTGIISKTRSFKTQNITPTSLSASAQLISMGARREEIVNRLYRSRPLRVLKLWGRILARLSGSLNNKIVWSALTQVDFAKTNTHEDDLSEVIDELIINIPEAKIIIIFYESESDNNASREQPQENNNFEETNGEQKQGKKTTKAIVYSVKSINSLALSKKWEPIGTKKIAIININKDIKEAEGEVISHIKEEFNKLSL